VIATPVNLVATTGQTHVKPQGDTVQNLPQNLCAKTVATWHATVETAGRPRPLMAIQN
jgi:hypothetical protein